MPAYEVKFQKINSKFQKNPTRNSKKKQFRPPPRGGNIGNLDADPLRNYLFKPEEIKKTINNYI